MVEGTRIRDYTRMIYFNEYDKQVAQWLQNLCPSATVDDRSIVDVKSDDLLGYSRVHLFAGIGGWELALRIAGVPHDFSVWTGSCPCQPFSVAGKGRGTADDRHLWPEMRRLVSECLPSVVFGEQVTSRAGREWLAGVRADLEALGYAVGASDLCAAGVGAPHIRQRLYWGAVRLPDAGSERRDGIDSLLRPRRSGEEDPKTPRGGPIGGVGDAEYTRSQGLWGSLRVVEGNARKVVREGEISRTSKSGTSRLGDSSRHDERGDPMSGAHGEGLETRGSGGIGGFWSQYDTIHFTDGKARRIEPGVEPLAHGVPGRVVKLRAYGNAIVPQVAAIFIKAFLAATGGNACNL